MDTRRKLPRICRAINRLGENPLWQYSVLVLHFCGQTESVFAQFVFTYYLVWRVYVRASIRDHSEALRLSNASVCGVYPLRNRDIAFRAASENVIGPRVCFAAIAAIAIL